MLTPAMLDDKRFLVLYREPNRKVEMLDVEREGDTHLFGPFTANQASELIEAKVASGEWDDGAACTLYADEPADAATAIERGHLNGLLFTYAIDRVNSYDSTMELRRYADGTHEVTRFPNHSNSAHQWRVPDVIVNYLPRSMDDLWEQYETEVINASS